MSNALADDGGPTEHFRLAAEAVLPTHCTPTTFSASENGEHAKVSTVEAHSVELMRRFSGVGGGIPAASSHPVEFVRRVSVGGWGIPSGSSHSVELVRHFSDGGRGGGIPSESSALAARSCDGRFAPFADSVAFRRAPAGAAATTAAAAVEAGSSGTTAAETHPRMSPSHRMPDSCTASVVVLRSTSSLLGAASICLPCLGALDVTASDSTPCLGALNGAASKSPPCLGALDVDFRASGSISRCSSDAASISPPYLAALGVALRANVSTPSEAGEKMEAEAAPAAEDVDCCLKALLSAERRL